MDVKSRNANPLRCLGRITKTGIVTAALTAAVVLVPINMAFASTSLPPALDGASTVIPTSLAPPINAISFSVPSINFGVQPNIGANVSRPITITNTYSQTITFFGWESLNPDVPQIIQSSCPQGIVGPSSFVPVVLQPGQSCTGNVTFVTGQDQPVTLLDAPLTVPYVVGSYTTAAAFSAVADQYKAEIAWDAQVVSSTDTNPPITMWGTFNTMYPNAPVVFSSANWLQVNGTTPPALYISPNGSPITVTYDGTTGQVTYVSDNPFASVSGGGGGTTTTPPPVTSPNCSPSIGGTVVGAAAIKAGGGYWMVGANGDVVTAGQATCQGSLAGTTLNKPIVAMALDPATGGYWMVASDGGVFAFNAPFFGSMGGKPLNKPIVGIASTPDGKGYWLVASDGGIFSFGDAVFAGSMGGKPLNQPIVGMTVDQATGGYWMVASDGGIFSFNAPFFGSMGGKPLNKPIVGMAALSSGLGYRFVASDGGVFDFGAATFLGSMGGQSLPAPVSGMAATPDGSGYWLVGQTGQIYTY